MKNRFIVLVMMPLLAGSLGGQVRQVSFTGSPSAVLSQPFSSLSAMHEVAPGKVVIADLTEQRLLLGDLQADRVSNVGTQGSGLGEWKFPLAVLPGGGGTAWVVDPGLRKLHRVDASGKIIAQQPFPDGDGPSMMLPRNADIMGRIYFTGAPFTPGQQSQPDSVPIIRWCVRYWARRRRSSWPIG